MNYIITADLHLRDDCPTCREDDFYNTQLKDLLFVVNQANANNAKLLIAGDIFHKPNISEKLLLDTYNVLAGVAKGIVMIAGNHDLPNHMLERRNECSYGVLAELLCWRYQKDVHLPNNCIQSSVLGYNWRADIASYENEHENTIAITHITVMSDIPIAEDKIISPETIFSWKALEKTSVIVCGDIHKEMLYSDKNSNRVILVPGSLNNQKSDTADYEPVIHLLNSSGKLSKIKIPQTDVRYAEKKEIRIDKKSNLAESIGRMGEQNILNLFYENLRNSNASKAEKLYIDGINVKVKGDPVCWNI